MKPAICPLCTLWSCMVYGSYALEIIIYNCHTPQSSCIHGYKLFDIIVQVTYTMVYSKFRGVWQLYSRDCSIEYNCHTPQASCIHGYKLFDIIVQVTYTIALSWVIELHIRGMRLNHSASSHGLNTRLSCTIPIRRMCEPYNIRIHFSKKAI